MIGKIYTVTAADAGYLNYLICHLASFARFKSKERNILITVFHRGIKKESQLEIQKMVLPNHEIQWISITSELLEELHAPLDFTQLTPHYFRLLTPYLLKNAQRAIYLDADTVVLEDINKLWSLDLEKYPIAAARDYIPCMREAVANYQEFSLDPEAPYFNSGVLLMNLEQWRMNKISEQVLQVCQENRQHLLAQQKWPQYDQYGLNVVLAEKWKELDSLWNYGTDRVYTSHAHILHYIGNGKVERPTCEPSFRQTFEETRKYANLSIH